MNSGKEPSRRSESDVKLDDDQNIEVQHEDSYPNMQMLVIEWDWSFLIRYGKGMNSGT